MLYSIQTEIKLYEAHAIVIVKNLQDIHNKNFLSSGLFKLVHQGWWTLQLINHVKAWLQKVPKTVQHHNKFNKRLSFTFGESCHSGYKALKAALPMILVKTKLALGISGLDSGYIFLSYWQTYTRRECNGSRLPPYRRTIVHLALCWQIVFESDFVISLYRFKERMAEHIDSEVILKSYLILLFSNLSNVSTYLKPNIQ